MRAATRQPGALYRDPFDNVKSGYRRLSSPDRRASPTAAGACPLHPDFTRVSNQPGFQRASPLAGSQGRSPSLKRSQDMLLGHYCPGDGGQGEEAGMFGAILFLRVFAIFGELHAVFCDLVIIPFVGGEDVAGIGQAGGLLRRPVQRAGQHIGFIAFDIFPEQA